MAQRLFYESVTLMPAMGALKECLDTFAAVVPKDVLPQNKVAYFRAANRLLFDVGFFYPVRMIRQKYLDAGCVATDSLVHYLQPESPDYKLYHAQLSYIKGDIPMLISDVQDIMQQVPMSDSRFAQGTYILGTYYEEKGRYTEAAYYLALSAISEIYGGRSCGISLQELGLVFNKRGEIDRAYSCLILAIDKANESRSMMYAIAASEALPIIARTVQEQSHARERWLTWFIVVICVTLIVIVGIIIWLRHEMTRLENMKSRLTETNRMKESYMGQILNLCYIYMEKQEEFYKVVSRKIAAGQTDDLYTMVKSGKLIDEQGRIFYDVFDEAFIKMYPTFVSDVNALLLDDRQIALADDRHLNTELRILAFLRLGIDDSTKVARFLGLSLNTIYSYRNKLKSRARNRSDFEDDIRHVGQIT
jgi:hypothetical protein